MKPFRWWLALCLAMMVAILASAFVVDQIAQYRAYQRQIKLKAYMAWKSCKEDGEELKRYVLNLEVDWCGDEPEKP
jgi:hypothetical protein